MHFNIQSCSTCEVTPLPYGTSRGSGEVLFSIPRYKRAICVLCNAKITNWTASSRKIAVFSFVWMHYYVIECGVTF